MRTVAKRVNWGNVRAAGIKIVRMSALFAAAGMAVSCGMMFKERVKAKTEMQVSTLAEAISEVENPQCVKDELTKIIREKGTILNYELGKAEEKCQKLALLKN